MASEGNRIMGRLPEFSKTKQLEWKRKMLVFSFFLAISVIIWLLNALSKNYTTEIKYPITYSRFPENKVLVSEVPDHLVLKVNAHGYAILSYKLTNRPIPINFPVSSFAMNRMSSDTSKSYLLTRYAREQVARQLPGELQLLEISPDSLIFKFATEISKKLPVEADISYEIERGFIIKNGIVLSPDSVLVSAPDIYLDTIQSIKTRKSSLGKLEKTYTGALKIKDIEYFKIREEEVSCTIELEKLTEVQVKVPILVSGIPDSLRIQTFPQEVRITGTVGLSEYSRIVPEAFRVEVSYDEILENKNRLQVQVISKPDALSAINIYPQTVEYILSVK